MTAPNPLTLHTWTPEVSAVIQLALAEFPHATANTYPAHPWPSWTRFSVDFWGVGGRGDAIPIHTGEAIRDFLFNLSHGPLIRHYIWRHTLWTSFGGFSDWAADDHSGILRHLHVTYWK